MKFHEKVAKTFSRLEYGNNIIIIAETIYMYKLSLSGFTLLSLQGIGK